MVKYTLRILSGRKYFYKDGKRVARSKVPKNKVTKLLGTVPKRPKGRKVSKKTVTWADRDCTNRKSKKNPNAFTKPELVNLAIKAGISKGEATKMTKEQICKELNKKRVKPDSLKRKKTPKKKGKAKPKLKLRGIPKTTRKTVRKLKVQKKKEKAKKIIQPKKQPSKPEPLIVVERRPGNCLNRTNLSLREHQIKVAQWMVNHRGLIAAYSVGSGKTLAAITASQCVLDNFPRMKVIVVTSVSLQQNFKKEMVKYGLIEEDPSYSFYTYGKFANSLKKGLITCDRNTFLIIDEAHNLRTNITGKKGGVRARQIMRCAIKAGKVLLLTATPLYNNVYDVANLVAMVRGKEPLTKAGFERVARNRLTFTNYFKCAFVFYDAPKDDNYPTSKEVTVRIPMSKAFYNKYRKIELAQSSKFGENPWLFMSGVRQAANALKPCLKCNWVVKKILTDPSQKMVIYSAFLTNGVEMLKAILTEIGIKYAEVTGKQNKKQRVSAVEQFNTNKVNVLLITKAGGEGLDLKGVRSVVILESSWNEATEDQVIGRAIRFRSHAHLPPDQRNVTIYRLMVVKPANVSAIEPPSADQILEDLSRRKQIQINSFLKRLKQISIDNKRLCK